MFSALKAFREELDWWEMEYGKRPTHMVLSHYRWQRLWSELDEMFSHELSQVRDLADKPSNFFMPNYTSMGQVAGVTILVENTKKVTPEDDP